MGLIQWIKSFRSKEIDREIKLRSYPNHGIYEDKEEGWGLLFDEISIIVEFYMFMYGIDRLIDVADYRHYVIFHFPELCSVRFIKALEREINYLFGKKVKCNAISQKMGVYFQSEKISFVE